MVTDENGLVAIQHYNANSASWKMGDGAVYSWTPAHNVSLAWVDAKHVDELLQAKAKVCCGKMQQKFYLAGPVNVSIHKTGDRPR